ncbi:MAG: copper homeostasis protein CutC [Bacteroidetes bacterium]|nr:copper homeostasis protein CutC [Bacteroidota bacterium]
MKNPDPATLLLEACVETLDEAVLAEKCGAHRIELCADLSVGGLTPPDELLEQAVQQLQIPMMAMVRPRGGDFVYSEEEFEAMKRSIEFCKNVGAAGVVFGCLTKKNEVDLEKTRELAALAQPLQVTFHKAIDITPDPVGALRKLLQVPGIQRVLTSGGSETALRGAAILREMVAVAGNRIVILAAGKVTKGNLAEVHRAVGTTEYHGRRIVF